MWFVINFEDIMLFESWFVELLRLHCMLIDDSFKYRKPRMAFHARISGFEVDVFIKCLGKNGEDTSIILEMKDNDLAKALTQALNRRHLADYVYVVINWSVAGIVEAIGADWLRPLAEEAFKKGIGIISGKDNAFVVVAKRFRRVSLAERIAGLTRWLGESGAGG